ncbi:MAG: dephospho-CoA kinase [Candidatus Borkfalkiaceae bacterium]|nr:dephospho-CoA kinase [Clostridia bacterium]MDY6223260.1 dephospho-CoA kinase [Christensenellaceae bacterium]
MNENEKRYEKTLPYETARNVEKKADETSSQKAQTPAYEKIAVTGGIGSGKSTVCALIKQAGYPVFSCDDIYAQMLTEPDFAAAVEILFPGSVTNGRVEKAALFQQIVIRNGAVELLNAFTHPKIMDRLFGKMNEAAKTSGALKVFAEVPLLFEGGFDKLFDKIIVVQRNETDKIQSVVARDRCKEEAVLKKMSLQFDYSLPPQKGNYPSFEKIVFLKNDVSPARLKTRLNALLKKL